MLAVYPVAQSHTDTESYLKYVDAMPLNRPMMLWFFAQVTTQPAVANDPRLDLVHADLKGLPPVTLINAEIDCEMMERSWNKPCTALESVLNAECIRG